MAIPISNVTRRQVYAPSGAGGAGPYAFTFEILANTDIAVFKDDTLLTLTTHYTVTINANGTGSVTITAAGLALAPVSPTQYAVVGNRAISRATDFTTGGDFFANTLNDELDQQTIFAQQNAEGVTRALQAPQTDPITIDMTLPRSSVRAGKVLSFDASGNPSATEFIGSNRGNWATGKIYYVRDIVKDTSTSNIWQCLTEHTSSGSQPISTNADSAKWFLLVDAAAAGTSATAAAASASAASTSASNASSSASAASTSASNAATAQTAAEAARDSALAAYDNFDDRYLGAKSSNPTLDNDGNALLAGALYFNTVAPEMRLWTGSAWVAAYVSGTGFVAKTGDTMTGALGIVAGSESAPGLFASGDTDTGIFFPASNTIAFSEGGGETMRIDNAGRVGIGTDDPATKLVIAGDNTLGTTNNTLRFWDTDGATQTDQQVGKIEFYSSDANAPGPSVKAYMGAFAEDNSPGVYLAFATDAETGTATEKMRIDSTGRLYLNTTSESAAGIKNAWAITSATTAYGQLNIGTVQSDVTGSLTNYYSNPSTAAATFTLGSLFHFRAQTATVGAGSAITSQYGFYIGSGFTEATTNNYGFYSNIPAATGDWNFYADGTAKNYFEGQTTVNSGLSIGRTAVTGTPAATDGNVFSGTYTPSLTNQTNVVLSTSYACQYMRVGNVVTVSGQIAIDPNTAADAVLGMSLPIASNFNGIQNLGGTFVSQQSPSAKVPGVIYADLTNDRATFFVTPNLTTNMTYSFSFTYLII